MKIHIGIDPGAHTGFAVWDSASRKFLEVATLPLHVALRSVLEWQERCRLSESSFSVTFEDARQRTWFPRERSNSEYRGRLMGAGAAKRDAAIWEEFLTDYRIPFEAIKPQPGKTKWAPDYWAHVTGWKKRTSEHARDAALLVFMR